ncbi:hypothetical protein HYV57_01030 [Candidatus Peregrinibacteria bacterium]|nr:hypothetical protein [Candidatus Peregrinibacteria bacterium]
MFSSPIKHWKKYCTLLFLVILLIIWYGIFGFHKKNPGYFYNTQNNAVWLEHRFSEDFTEDSEIEKLARELHSHAIRYVFLHAGPFESDGTISAQKYQAASRFLKIARQTEPDIIWLAWIGQLRSLVNIDDPSIRFNMVKTAEILTRTIGFDGIHVNIEPIPHGNASFLLLLKEMRNSLGDSSFLSVTSDEWQSQWMSEILSFLLRRQIESYWGTSYFTQVGSIVDQIVVMTYDSRLTKPWLYSWWVEQQTIYSTKALKGTRAKILIGIPVYKKASASFFPEAENITTGLIGITRGLNNIRATLSAFDGVALYPYWTLEEQDWKEYDRLWGKAKNGYSGNL